MKVLLGTHNIAGWLENYKIGFEKVVKYGKASTVALGSVVVYQRKGMGVLVNFPDEYILSLELAK